MRKIIYVLIFSFLLIGNLYAQLTGGLASTYNSLKNKDDISRYLKMDYRGNMYVAGNTVTSVSNRDYLLIKYDMNGKLLWYRNYDGLMHGNDTVRSLYVDIQGNVYVTGCSQGYKKLYDAVTIKYDSEGNVIWERRYRETISGSSFAYDVVTDNDLNVYVTGWCDENGTHECMLLKYTPAGELAFKVKYNGSSNGYDEGTCLALSNDMRHIYMGANVDETNGRYNMAIVKFDIQGNFIWKCSYNGSGNGNDFFSSIGVDKDGFIYGCGNSPGVNQMNDIVLIKADSEGNILWNRRYDGPSNGTDWTCCLKLDKENNIYLAGGILGVQGHNDASVLKYNSSGKLLWISTFNGQNNWHDCCQGLDFDDNLNVYMSGRTCLTGNEESDDIFTVKVDKFGNKIWTKIYNGPDNNADYSSNLVYNKFSKTVFTLGHSYSNNTHYDVVMIKYMEKNAVYDMDNSTGSNINYNAALTNYPNPFNPYTKIQFTIPKYDFVKISVYDLSGRLVKNLIESYQTAGSHQINFDGSNLSSGVYFYTMQTSTDKITNRLILNK